MLFKIYKFYYNISSSSPTGYNTCRTLVNKQPNNLFFIFNSSSECSKMLHKVFIRKNENLSAVIFGAIKGIIKWY